MNYKRLYLMFNALLIIFPALVYHKFYYKIEESIVFFILLLIPFIFGIISIIIYTFDLKNFFIYYFGKELVMFLFIYIMLIGILYISNFLVSNISFSLIALLIVISFLILTFTYGKKVFYKTLKKNIKNKVFNLDEGLYDPSVVWGHYWVQRVSNRKRNAFYGKLGLLAAWATVLGTVTAGILTHTRIEKYYGLFISVCLFTFLMFYLSIKIYGYIWIKKWEKENGRKMRLKL